MALKVFFLSREEIAMCYGALEKIVITMQYFSYRQNMLDATILNKKHYKREK